MSNSSYRWVIVAAGALLGCVAVGSMFSLPVFLTPISHETGWSIAGISTAMTIALLAMAFGSIAWGTLAASIALASQAASLLQFQLVFGLLVGIATSAIFAPMMACVTGWFDTQRSLAVSLVSAGMGIAPMTMAPLAAWIVSNHPWRTSLLIIACVAAVLMIPAALLIRRPP